MKSLGVIALLIATMNPCFASLGKLEMAQGEYQVKDQSDFVCKKLKSFNLEVIGEDAVLTYQRENVNNGGRIQTDSETIKDINTRKYTSLQTMTAIVYFRNVFKKNKLIKQESVWALGVIPAPYKDSRTILEVVDSETVIYNLPFYGTKTCELIRI